MEKARRFEMGWGCSIGTWAISFILIAVGLILWIGGGSSLALRSIQIYVVAFGIFLLLSGIGLVYLGYRTKLGGVDVDMEGISFGGYLIRWGQIDSITMNDSTDRKNPQDGIYIHHWNESKGKIIPMIIPPGIQNRDELFLLLTSRHGGAITSEKADSTPGTEGKPVPIPARGEEGTSEETVPTPKAVEAPLESVMSCPQCDAKMVKSANNLKWVCSNESCDAVIDRSKIELPNPWVPMGSGGAFLVFGLRWLALGDRLPNLPLLPWFMLLVGALFLARGIHLLISRASASREMGG